MCRRHHEEITILNGQQARKVHHQLSNKHRWRIWFQWREGKSKVRRTKKALEYIAEWGHGITVQSDSQVATPDPVERERTEYAAVSAESQAPKKTKRGRKKKKIASKSRRRRAVRRTKGSERLERKKKRKKRKKRKNS